MITWNCNMAFRYKSEKILRYRPDVLVIPECEHPDKILLSGLGKLSDCCWFGTNRHKGLGIFAFNNYKLKPIDNYQPEIKTIVPLQVSNGNTDFNLLAVWANNPSEPKYQYVGQVWKAIHHYKDFLQEKKIILAGDFNSNTIWDRPKRNWNHSHVVALLAQHKISSAYHQYFNQQQGKEKHSTFYLYRHKDKPYHLDYCFASAYFTNKLASVSIGTHHKWGKYSDHSPLIATFSL